MRSLRRLVTRIRNFLTRRRNEARVREEIQEHLYLDTEANIRAGMPAEEAYRQSVLQFGSLAAIREEYRAEESLPFVETLLADLRYAARILSKSPNFTVAACLSLALAIGANTAIFSAASQLLYQRLAVPHAADLRLLTWKGTEHHVAVHHVNGDYNRLPGGLVTSTAFSYPVYRQLRAQNRFFTDLFAFSESGMNAAARQTAYHVLVEMVSGNYYSVLQVKPQLGRALGPSDDTPGSQLVAVISDGFWTRAYARSPSVLGQALKLSDKPFVIVGVNDSRFTGAKSTLPSETPDVTIALASQPLLRPSSDGTSWIENPNVWWVNVLGRARGQIPDATAQSTLNTQLGIIVHATMPVRKGDDLPRLVLRDGSRGLFEQEQIFAQPLTVLMIFVGLVLLLACANMATLMLARGSNRQREMCVRLALGAGRSRIFRQLLVESLLLAGIGGTLGLAFGYLGRIALPQLTVTAWQRTSLSVQFDWRVFAFAAALTVFAGIFFGLAPALAAANVELNTGLKLNAQTATRKHKGIASRTLVGFQVALSTLLVISAGLFIRTLVHMSAIQPGFNTHNLLLADISLPQNRYRAGRDIAFHQKLEQSIASIPGVVAVAPATDAYLYSGLSTAGITLEGESRDREKNNAAAFNVVGIRFLQTLQIPLLGGRTFSPRDTASSPKVAIINRTLARTRFPNQDPIGKRFSYRENELIQIVGICGDTRYTDLRQSPPPQFFLPYVQQAEIDGMTYEIRTGSRPMPSSRHFAALSTQPIRTSR